MNITVSKIKSRALRRLVLALTYPLAAVFGVALICAWNALIDFVASQVLLARTALEQWSKR